MRENVAGSGIVIWWDQFMDSERAAIIKPVGYRDLEIKIGN